MLFNNNIWWIQVATGKNYLYTAMLVDGSGMNYPHAAVDGDGKRIIDGFSGDRMKFLENCIYSQQIVTNANAAGEFHNFRFQSKMQSYRRGRSSWYCNRGPHGSYWVTTITYTYTG